LGRVASKRQSGNGGKREAEEGKIRMTSDLCASIGGKVQKTNQREPGKTLPGVEEREGAGSETSS